MTTRHYLYAGTCTGLIADDDLTLYMCPDDGLLVIVVAQWRYGLSGRRS